MGPHCSCQLKFVSAEPVGTVKYCNNSWSIVSANLTKNYVQNKVRVLQCQLTIILLSNHHYLDDVKVVCRNSDRGTETSYPLRINSKYVTKLIRKYTT